MRRAIDKPIHCHLNHLRLLHKVLLPQLALIY